MKILDFRSDTVTKPTPEMRDAMAKAEVGDDVYGEDPSVNRLQELSAEMTGKEAGLFIPSGTMGNLSAVLAHCQRGDEVIMGTLAHLFLYEAGSIAAVGGVQPHTIPNQDDATLKLEEIERAIRPKDAHFPQTKLITIENTQNKCGGQSISADYTDQVGELAKEHDLKLHIDGARIFNAAADQRVSAKDLVAAADSVTFCLSKGLGAPVGSVLCGSKEFIVKAHRMRKQLGGGMRQAGIIAAAGIYALENNVERLYEDHARASRLAELVKGIDGIDFHTQNTNMTYFAVKEETGLTSDQFLQKIKQLGLLAGAEALGRIRMVTHIWITDADIKKAAEIMRQVLN
jgi:threonine aldolase